jgi:hypothetical protein
MKIHWVIIFHNLILYLALTIKKIFHKWKMWLVFNDFEIDRPVFGIIWCHVY